MDDHNTAIDLRRVLADTVKENGRLRMQRDALAEILRGMLFDASAPEFDGNDREKWLSNVWERFRGLRKQARAALAKLEGAKP